jgi:hypothetical protein
MGREAVIDEPSAVQLLMVGAASGLFFGILVAALFSRRH